MERNRVNSTGGSSIGGDSASGNASGTPCQLITNGGDDAGRNISCAQSGINEGASGPVPGPFWQPRPPPPLPHAARRAPSIQPDQAHSHSWLELPPAANSVLYLRNRDTAGPAVAGPFPDAVPSGVYTDVERTNPQVMRDGGGGGTSSGACSVQARSTCSGSGSGSGGGASIAGSIAPRPPSPPLPPPVAHEHSLRSSSPTPSLSLTCSTVFHPAAMLGDSSQEAKACAECDGSVAFHAAVARAVEAGTAATLHGDFHGGRNGGPIISSGQAAAFGTSGRLGSEGGLGGGAHAHPVAERAAYARSDGGVARAQRPRAPADPEAALAAAVAVARASAEAAFRSPEARLYRPKSAFTARRAAGASPRAAVAGGARGGSAKHVFVGVSAIAAPFAAFSPRSTPAGSVRATADGGGGEPDPDAAAGDVHAADDAAASGSSFSWGLAGDFSYGSLPAGLGAAGSLLSGLGGGDDASSISLFDRVERLLPPPPVSSAVAGARSPRASFGPSLGGEWLVPSPRGGGGGVSGGGAMDGEFFRRQELLLRKRQAWAAQGERQRKEETQQAQASAIHGTMWDEREAGWTGASSSARSDTYYRQRLEVLRQGLGLEPASGNGVRQAAAPSAAAAGEHFQQLQAANRLEPSRLPQQSQPLRPLPPSQPRPCGLPEQMQRWAAAREARLQAMRREREAEKAAQEALGLTFQPAIGERSRRLAQAARARSIDGNAQPWQSSGGGSNSNGGASCVQAADRAGPPPPARSAGGAIATARSDAPRAPPAGAASAVAAARGTAVGSAPTSYADAGRVAMSEGGVPLWGMGFSDRSAATGDGSCASDGGSFGAAPWEASGRAMGVAAAAAVPLQPATGTGQPGHQHAGPTRPGSRLTVSSGHTVAPYGAFGVFSTSSDGGGGDSGSIAGSGSDGPWHASSRPNPGVGGSGGGARLLPAAAQLAAARNSRSRGCYACMPAGAAMRAPEDPSTAQQRRRATTSPTRHRQSIPAEAGRAAQLHSGPRAQGQEEQTIKRQHPPGPAKQKQPRPPSQQSLHAAAPASRPHPAPSRAPSASRSRSRGRSNGGALRRAHEAHDSQSSAYAGRPHPQGAREPWYAEAQEDGPHHSEGPSLVADGTGGAAGSADPWVVYTRELVSASASGGSGSLASASGGAARSAYSGGLGDHSYGGAIAAASWQQSASVGGGDVGAFRQPGHGAVSNSRRTSGGSGVGSVGTSASTSALAPAAGADFLTGGLSVRVPERTWLPAAAGAWGILPDGCGFASAVGAGSIAAAASGNEGATGRAGPASYAPFVGPVAGPPAGVALGSGLGHGSFGGAAPGAHPVMAVGAFRSDPLSSSLGLPLMATPTYAAVTAPQPPLPPPDVARALTGSTSEDSAHAANVPAPPPPPLLHLGPCAAQHGPAPDANLSAGGDVCCPSSQVDGLEACGLVGAGTRACDGDCPAASGEPNGQFPSIDGTGSWLDPSANAQPCLGHVAPRVDPVPAPAPAQAPQSPSPARPLSPLPSSPLRSSADWRAVHAVLVAAAAAAAAAAASDGDLTAAAACAADSDVGAAGAAAEALASSTAEGRAEGGTLPLPPTARASAPSERSGADGESDGCSPSLNPSPASPADEAVSPQAVSSPGSFALTAVASAPGAGEAQAVSTTRPDGASRALPPPAELTLEPSAPAAANAQGATPLRGVPAVAARALVAMLPEPSPSSAKEAPVATVAAKPRALAMLTGPWKAEATAAGAGGDVPVMRREDSALGLLSPVEAPSTTLAGLEVAASDADVTTDVSCGPLSCEHQLPRTGTDATSYPSTCQSTDTDAPALKAASRPEGATGPAAALAQAAVLLDSGESASASSGSSGSARHATPFATAAAAAALGMLGMPPSPPVAVLASPIRTGRGGSCDSPLPSARSASAAAASGASGQASPCGSQVRGVVFARIPSQQFSNPSSASNTPRRTGSAADYAAATPRATATTGSSTSVSRWASAGGAGATVAGTALLRSVGGSISSLTAGGGSGASGSHSRLFSSGGLSLSQTYDMLRRIVEGRSEPPPSPPPSPAPPSPPPTHGSMLEPHASGSGAAAANGSGRLGLSRLGTPTRGAAQALMTISQGVPLDTVSSGTPFDAISPVASASAPGLRLGAEAAGSQKDTELCGLVPLSAELEATAHSRSDGSSHGECASRNAPQQQCERGRSGADMHVSGRQLDTLAVGAAVNGAAPVDNARLDANSAIVPSQAGGTAVAVKASNGGLSETSSAAVANGTDGLDRGGQRAAGDGAVTAGAGCGDGDGDGDGSAGCFDEYERDYCRSSLGSMAGVCKEYGLDEYGMPEVIGEYDVHGLGDAAFSDVKDEDAGTRRSGGDAHADAQQSGALTDAGRVLSAGALDKATAGEMAVLTGGARGTPAPPTVKPAAAADAGAVAAGGAVAHSAAPGGDSAGAAAPIAMTAPVATAPVAAAAAAAPACDASARDEASTAPGDGDMAAPRPGDRLQTRHGDPAAAGAAAVAAAEADTARCGAAAAPVQATTSQARIDSCAAADLADAVGPAGGDRREAGRSDEDKDSLTTLQALISRIAQLSGPGAAATNAYTVTPAAPAPGAAVAVGAGAILNHAALSLSGGGSATAEPTASQLRSQIPPQPTLTIEAPHGAAAAAAWSPIAPALAAAPAGAEGALPLEELLRRAERLRAAAAATMAAGAATAPQPGPPPATLPGCHARVGPPSSPGRYQYSGFPMQLHQQHPPVQHTHTHLHQPLTAYGVAHAVPQRQPSPSHEAQLPYS